MTLPQRISALQGRWQQIQTDLAEARTSLAAAEVESTVLTDVLSIFETAGTHSRERVRAEVGGLAGAAMRDVFGDDSGADVQFRQSKRGFTARLITRRGSMTGHPRRIDGGSTCKLLSVALRAAALKRLRDLPQFLLLDEPLTGLDKDHVWDAVAWLRALAEQANIQVVAIAHEFPEAWEASASKIIEIEGPAEIKGGGMLE